MEKIIKTDDMALSIAFLITGLPLLENSNVYSKN